MKYYIFLLFSLTLLLTSCEQEKGTKTEIEAEPIVGTSTFYFIRHAEKDRSDAKNKDPHLTDEGIARAEKWNKVFSNVKFDAIYSTDYNRTRETAEPTANANELELTMYDPSAIDGLAFLEENKGKRVLVVGHSNTTPSFVNSILTTDKYPQIEDDNNANLYVVKVSSKGELLDMLLVFN